MANSVAKSIVIGDGGVDGGQSTVAHLQENLPRPVAKLQSVDSRGRFAGFLHAEISPDRRPSRSTLTSNSRSALIQASLLDVSNIQIRGATGDDRVAEGRRVGEHILTPAEIQALTA